LNSNYNYDATKASEDSLVDDTYDNVVGIDEVAEKAF
jgi:hypothetical protein